jgi:general secretion pathway protein N
MNLRLVWLGLVAFLLALITALPVRWIAGLLPGQVRCAAWSGTVWLGQCTGLTTVQQAGPALEIEVLRWKLHPVSLLRLSLKADFSVRTAQGSGSGVAELGSNGRIAVQDLAVNAVFDRRLATMLAEGWKGQLDARHLNVRMQGNTLQALSGEIDLRDFNDGQGAAYGSYRLVFPPAAAPPFTGRITDTGGPFEVAATVTISADRRWLLDGLVSPRPETSPNLRAKLDLLAAPDANGRHRLQSEGSFR